MEKYIQLQPLREEDFATATMFEIAQKAHEPLMVPFANLVEEIKSPTAKHLFKMIESTVRTKPGSTLDLDFDDDRAEIATIKELYIEPSSGQNALMNVLCDDMAKHFKSFSNKVDEVERFEKNVCKHVGELIRCFYDTLANPEEFHKKKKQWLNSFNQVNGALKPVVSMAVTADEGLVAEVVS